MSPFCSFTRNEGCMGGSWLIRFAVVVALLRLGLTLLNNPDLALNNDEGQNYAVALRHVEGHGYTRFDEGLGQYRTTAFFNGTTLQLYEWMIRAHVPVGWWVLFIMLASGVAFIYSVPALRSLAGLLMPDRWALRATIVYVLFPSVLFYIGSLFLYENLAASLLIICMHRLVRSLELRMPRRDLALITFAIIVSVLLRPQMLIVYTIVLGIYVVLTWRTQRMMAVGRWIPLAVLGFVCHWPVLRLNHELFGHYTLGTQTGFEVLQGHNPTARGSWLGQWQLPSSPLYKYVHEQVPGVDTLDEYEEGKARRDLALRWIAEEPLAALKLDAKKMVLYFVPNNYERLAGNRWWHPMNGLVYAFFMIALFRRIRARRFTRAEVMLLAPFIASVLITVLFFMGARWRFYAEPFMVLFAMDAVSRMFNRQRAAS